MTVLGRLRDMCPELDLQRLPRGTKRAIMLAADGVMIPLALWCAFALRVGELKPVIPGAYWLFPAAIVFSIPTFVRLGLYRAVVRFMGQQVAFAVLKGVTLSVVLLAAATLLSGVQGLPRSVFFIFWALAVIYIGGSRFLMRSYLHSRRPARDRVAIYGAGDAGAQLVAALAGGDEFNPIVIVDDRKDIQGSVIHGVKVHGPTDLAWLIQNQDISQVLLAVPSLSRRRRRQIIAELESLPVHVKTIPGYSDLIAGHARVDEIRDVDVEDLLGRDAVPPNDSLLDACIRGKAVMVTGAGGSIGSELCRQIVRLGPTHLVLFEASELALYTIERDLRLVAQRENLAVEIVGLLGSVLHKLRVREALKAYAVNTVYHAAAYKHVPIVEHNAIEGVQNNIFGTWHAAEAALEAGVETFVLISTDKAVSPANVMGATKRFAELVLQGLHQLGGRTRFCMVRFGNVLASSGSVVPLFRDQIQKGGPVTVTHPEIIRYFMTIPEAAQLVIQAGSMGRGGDVFVLDMGEPVKISDLARRMINLMGLEVREEANPDGDIAIVYTGLRPAEKLYEELLIGDNVTGTDHPNIMRAEEVSLPWPQVNELLDDFMNASRQFDCGKIRSLLLEAVHGYSPADGVQDLVWKRQAVAAEAAGDNITSLSAAKRGGVAPALRAEGTTE